MGLHVCRVHGPDMDTAVESVEDWAEQYNPYKDEGCLDVFAVIDAKSGLVKIYDQSLADQWGLESLNSIEKLNEYYNYRYHGKANYYVDQIRSIINQDVPPDTLNTQMLLSMAEHLNLMAKFANKKIDVLTDFINDDWPNREGISELSDYTKKLYLVLCDTSE